MSADGTADRYTARRRRLRELTAALDGRLLLAIGVGGGAEARLLHHTLCDLEDRDAVPDYIGGFVFFVSGYLCAAAHGLPDLGLVLRPEIVQQTDIVEQATWMAALDRGRDAWPIGVDIDTGYGNEPSAVLLSCRQAHKQGASYVQIEDQYAINKSCGHMDGSRGGGKQVVDAEEMVERRLAPALAYAAEQDDLMVAARTDALAGFGIDEAMRRASRYVEAGAQMIFVEAPESDAHLERIAKEFAGSRALNIANMVEGSGKTPYKSPREIHALGFDVALYPIGAFLAGHAQQTRYFEALGTGRSDLNAVDPGFFERFNQAIGRTQIQAWNGELPVAEGSGAPSESPARGRSASRTPRSPRRKESK